MKIKLVFFVALFFAIGLCAQENKLGKVTVEELQQKYHPTDSSAAAAILFKESHVTISPDQEGRWIASDEVIVKIKIYKKEGYSYANFEALLYNGKLNDVLIFYDEATYNLVDGKVERTKMKNEGEFTEKRSKYYNVKKIALPNVREGSIIEYRYVKTSHIGGNLDSFFMQFDIPANYVSYTVDAPDKFKYNKVVGGYLQPEYATKSLTVNNSGLNYLRDYFLLKNVPAMNNEEFVDNINNYRTHLKYELSAYMGTTTTTKFSETWDEVVKNIYDHEDFGPELNKKNYFEEDIARLTAGVTDKTQLTNLIFDYVQKRMNWNEYLGYYAEKGVRQAYTDKSGNVADINLMLTAMLRHAGIDANPVLVSTRSNGINIFPSRTAFNYVISAVEIPDGLILLDATSKNTRPNVLPKRAINWYGRIIRNYGSSAQVELRPTFLSKEVSTVMASLSDDGSLTGKVRRQYTDYVAYNFRENYAGVNEDSYLEKLEGRYSGIEVSEYNRTDPDDITKPVIENYTFNHSAGVEKIGDKLYLSPLLFFTLTDNPFKQDDRKYPVDFVFPHQDKYNLTIALPEGYKVESFPAAVKYAMPDNVAQFKFNGTASDKQIQLSVYYDMNEAMIGAEYYESLKTFFKEMIAKQSEKIVLKRI